MNNKLTLQEIACSLLYNQETGIFTRIGRDRVYRNKPLGTVNSNGYLVIRQCGLHYAHRLAWLFLTGDWPNGIVDHINRNRLDNRACNLRLADKYQSRQNVGISQRNTSGVRGVYWNRSVSKWHVAIQSNGVRHYIGVFDDLATASAAYDCAARRLHGPFAVANNAARLKARAA